VISITRYCRKDRRWDESERKTRKGVSSYWMILRKGVSSYWMILRKGVRSYWMILTL